MSAISETIALVAPFTGQFAAGRPTTATTTAVGCITHSPESDQGEV